MSERFFTKKIKSCLSDYYLLFWISINIFCGSCCCLSSRSYSMSAALGIYVVSTDYGRPNRKYPSLHGRKFNPNPKFLGTDEAYFVSHIGPNFQISLICAFISSLRVRSPWQYPYRTKPIITLERENYKKKKRCAALR